MAKQAMDASIARPPSSPTLSKEGRDQAEHIPEAWADQPAKLGDAPDG